MIGAIIQARMGANRLPGKPLMLIKGKPMLWYLVERLRHSELVDKIIIATTSNPKDKTILNFANENSIPVMCGSEDDVLDRFYEAAKKIKADIIVRVTADCPLLDPKVVDEVIAVYLEGDYDYVTNTLLYTFPDGLDVEVFSFNALKRAHIEAKSKIEREHVTPYIRNSGLFKLKNVVNKSPVPTNLSRWCVDEERDFRFVKTIYEYLYKEGKLFYMKDVMSLLKKYPQIQQINSGIITNEGYYKSLTDEPPIRPTKISIKNSLACREKAEILIPSCTQTFSKGPTQFVQGVAPVFLEKGKGSHVWDVDRNEYIDYTMALGPVVLGYNYPSVTSTVKRHLDLGTVFTLPHKLEIELSELLVKTIPCAEMVRFGKNGSDVTSGAIRVARAYTRRDKIACCGYHGWQDWYIGTTTRDKGIPQAVKKLTLTFEYNNVDSLRQIFNKNKNQIAAVIMEPTGIIEPKDNFLAEVKELTHKNGAILIFDEVITGFRLALGGAQEYFKVVPDMACFGKAMGNGFPIAAVTGKREIMKLFDEVFFSFTFGGEILSIVAAIATIKEIKEKNVIAYLWEQGRKLKDGYNVLAREYALEKYTQCIGFSPRTVVKFKDERQKDDLVLESLFQQECIKRKILFTGAHNMSFSHSSTDIDYTLRVYRTVLEIIAKAKRDKKVARLLKGKSVEPIFRKP